MAKTIIPAEPIKRKFKRKVKRIKKLTLKQSRFCHEYVVDGIGSAAAIRAGYNPASAHVTADKLLSNIKCKQLIEKLESTLHKKLEISAERTLLEVARLAFFDPQKLFDADGKLIPIHKLDKDTAACIGGIDTYQKYVGTDQSQLYVEVVKKFKIWDKNSALEKLIKRFQKTFEPSDGEDAAQPKRIFFNTVDASKQPEETESKE